MGFTVSQVLEFVAENDVKFIRLAFCNLLGVQKNVSIMAGELERAFREGVCVDVAAAEGFPGGGEGDVFLHPDPDTLAVLPWRPSHGRVARFFCELRYGDGSPCPGDGRYLLRRTCEKAAEMGYTVNVGCECEFYLFRLDEEGEPTLVPQDSAGFCDIAPLDKGENVRREICLALEDMGIEPLSSHHERGPGQNEIVCRYAGPLESADSLVSFRAVSEVIAARSGLHASFLPKPLADCNGSGLHVNLSLARGGKNLFRSGREHNQEAEWFLAGVLHHLRDLTLFLNPLADSYARLGSDIPRTLAWSHENRDQLVRIPAAEGEYSRMELRSPDPMCNPYLAFALLVEAGLDGIRRQMPLVRDLPGSEYPLLPATLAQAIEVAEASALVGSVLPQDAWNALLDAKKKEAAPE